MSVGRDLEGGVWAEVEGKRVGYVSVQTICFLFLKDGKCRAIVV